MKEVISNNKNLLRGVGASLGTALGMLLLPHAEVVIALVLILGVMFLKLDKRKRSVLIKTFLIVAIVVIAIVFHIFYCNKKEDVNNTLPEETTQQDTTSTDNTAPVVNTAPVSTETTTSVNNTVNTNTRRQNITDYERAKSQDLNPIYGGGEGDNANKNGGKQNVDNAISPEMVGQDGEESKGYKEEAVKADKEEDIKAEQNQDNSFTIDADNTKEEEAEAGNVNGSTEAGDDESTSWGDIANGDDATNYEPVKVEDDKVEDNKVEDNKVEDDKVEDNKVEDDKVEDDKVEDNKVEDDKVEDDKVEDDKVEDDKVEDDKVEDNKEKAVKVVAIDGYETTVNSQIQFKITGDNVKFDGLQGIDYDFDGEILTISVGGEATILTIEASNSTSSTTFDVVVNGIIR